MAKGKVSRTKKGIIGFGVVLIISALVFGAFQLFNPIEAEAPTGADPAVSPVPVGASQDLSDNIAEAAVLMYHHIGPNPDENDKIRSGLTVSEEEFAEQIKYIFANGYTVMTLSELAADLSAKNLPEKPLVLTFDDGYDDNYIYAKPILDKFGFKGTFFIISGKIGQAEYMNEDQIKELSKNHEIGSHSYSHPSMVRLSDYYLERELKNSKDDLQALTGQEVISFCYPAGKYDDKVVEKLEEYGYKIAVTTEASTGSVAIDNLFLVPRYRIAPAISLETLLR